MATDSPDSDIPAGPGAGICAPLGEPDGSTAARACCATTPNEGRPWIDLGDTGHAKAICRGQRRIGVGPVSAVVSAVLSAVLSAGRPGGTPPTGAPGRRPICRSPSPGGSGGQPLPPYPIGGDAIGHRPPPQARAQASARLTA